MLCSDVIVCFHVGIDILQQVKRVIDFRSIRYPKMSKDDQ